jgi:arylsulfatase A-like enzyme
MKRREFLRSAAAPVFLQQANNPPNIIWLTGEDMGPSLGCYGLPQMRTPHLDQLAAEGVRYTRTFTTAPVCSSSRSAFMTGVYQTTSGTHHHRSHRQDGYQLPAGVRLITDRLRERGYFTCNVRGLDGTTGKTDFNWAVKNPFDGSHWNQRAKNQPLFAHINYQAPHKGPAFPLARKQKYLVDPAQLSLPPYWPDDPVVRDEYANHLDAINLLDSQIGATLGALRRDGLLENALVVFFGDNGRCLIRGKQWLYDAGIHIPLIMHWPGGGLRAGTLREDLTLSLDITATALRAAGIEIPVLFDGRPLSGAGAKTRDHVIAARDRCDMTVDRIRCIRTDRFKYIRNFMPDRPYTQWNEYIERSYPTLAVMQKLHQEGKLNPVQSLFMASRKPEEELYDLAADPHEVNNLASAPKMAKVRSELSARLQHWISESNDQGQVPETEEARRLE